MRGFFNTLFNALPQLIYIIKISLKNSVLLAIKARQISIPPTLFVSKMAL